MTSKLFISGGGDKNLVEGVESTRGTLENTDENRMLFVRSPHHKHSGKAQYLVL